MPPHRGPQPDDSEIEELKKKLYSRTAKDEPISDIRAPLSPRIDDVPLSFAKPPEEEAPAAPKLPPIAALMATPKRGLSFAAKFLIASTVFFTLAAGAAAYMFFIGGNIISPQNIDLEGVAPSLVDSGKEASMEILIQNRNTSPIKLVDLIIEYPEGTRDPKNPSQPLLHVRESVGDIESGQQIKKKISGIFYGKEGTAQKVHLTLSYTVEHSNAVYEKESDINFLIGSSPISLSIETPSEVIAGQPFTVDITVQSNAATTLENVSVSAQYPFGFKPTSATPQSLAGGTFWNLGSFEVGTSKTIHLTGTIDGQDGDAKVIRFMVGSNTDSTNTKVEVPVLTIPQTLTVRKPFISAEIAVNGQTGNLISVPTGSALQGTITWKNNLPVAVSNVELVLSLTGPALDKSSVGTANGFYQSQSGTITWSPTQESSLQQVQPGGTGTFNFSFSTLPAGSGGVLITNPTINLSLGVSGTRTDSPDTAAQVNVAAKTSVSVATQLSLAAQALHFTGPIKNTGPMPPKPEQDTSYTILWTVKNSSNTIANAIVTTQLPPYVKYVSAGSGASYDAQSRTVSWNLGDLPAGVGYSSSAKQAYFQVVLTPSANQVGTALPLTGNVVLRGQDRFAQVSVEASATAPTTALSEAGFSSGMDIVAPK